jgi:hypothetical protein
MTINSSGKRHDLNENLVIYVKLLAAIKRKYIQNNKIKRYIKEVLQKEKKKIIKHVNFKKWQWNENSVDSWT